MKLEKINENQIRCTLTSEDLANRHIRLSELAYGSEKAKNLFHDMMNQARKKFGFDADNIPLMIEAIPLSADSITLLITKVEDPEELDTRFARFAPHTKGEAETPDISIEDADDILNLIRKLYDAKQRAVQPDPDASLIFPEETAPAADIDFVRIYRFKTLDRVIDAALGLGGIYKGNNTLFKADGDLPYVLVIHKSASTPETFNKVCNILSEYGESAPCTPAREANLREHAQIIIDQVALSQLYSLK